MKYHDRKLEDLTAFDIDDIEKDLALCPFCGAFADLVKRPNAQQQVWGDNKLWVWNAGCSRPDCIAYRIPVWRLDPRDSAKKWNKRTDSVGEP